jgi:hypothetical protein
MLDRSECTSRTLVVRDGSGSMFNSAKQDSPINIATSLAILFSEQLSGAFKNTFITFSSEPRLVELPDGASLEEKIAECLRYDEIANTNIEKVYRLILDTALSGKVPQREMIERVLIISDMEFDSCAEGVLADGGVSGSTFDAASAAFMQAGYKMPELVFWNVAARHVHTPVTMNTHNVKLVSGASAAIFRQVVANTCELLTPYQFMERMLADYSEFNTLAV